MSNNNNSIFLDKNNLFIFMHLPKCAGTEIREHLYTQYSKEEILTLYDSPHFPPTVWSYDDVDNALNKLNANQKDKIKFIFGHYVYYGIHKHFKNRTPKYITFLRDPIDRTISHYNWDLMRYHKSIMPEYQIPQIFHNSDDLSFSTWFKTRTIDKVAMDNYSFRYLMNFVLKDKLDKNIINSNNIDKIKSILNSFFFIGLTQNPDDFYFLYTLFGIEKLIPKQNVSDKYIKIDDIIRIRREYSKHFSIDEEIYNHAYEINKMFRKKYPFNFPDKLVSIIMPSYNHEKYIGEAIESVIYQSYKNWELIIFDDGSTDNSIKIIKKYEAQYKNKIKLYTHANNKNLGISETYQTAFKLAKGDFIAFLESDDVWLYDSLAIKINVFEKHQHVDLVYCGVHTFGDPEMARQKNEYLKSFSSFETYKPFKAFNYLSLNNLIPTFSTAMIRNKFKNLNFPHKHIPWTDWWIWTQISLKGYFYFIPLKKTKWRVYPESYNSRFTKSLDSLDDYYEEYKNDLFELTKNYFKIDNDTNCFSPLLFESYIEFCKLYKRTQNKLDFYCSENKLAALVNAKDTYLQDHISNVDKLLLEKDEIFNNYILSIEKIIKEKDMLLNEHIAHSEKIIKEKDTLVNEQAIHSEKIIKEKDMLLNKHAIHSEKIIKEKDTLLNEHAIHSEKIIKEKDMLLNERAAHSEKIIKEKDMLLNERAAHSEKIIKEKDMLLNEQAIHSEKIIKEKDNQINNLNILLNEKKLLIDYNVKLIEGRERLFKEKVDYLSNIIEDIRKHTPKEGETIINIRNLNRLKMISLLAPLYAYRFLYRHINTFAKKHFER